MSEWIRYGKSLRGYGWWVWFGKRVRWTSGKAWTPTWPRIKVVGDEYCNMVFQFIIWPIGGLEVWYARHQRTESDGLCEECKREMLEDW